MSTKLNKIFIYLFLLIPIFLITGPAIPDIIITFTSIYFLINLIFFEKNINNLNNFFVKKIIIFWVTLIFVSFFAINKIESFQDSIIFIRFLLVPIFGIYFLLNNEKYIKKLLFVIFVLVIFVMIDTSFQFFNYNSKDGFGSDILGFKSEWYGRLTGPFGDELVPGVFISRFGLIGYLFFLYYKNNNKIFFFEILYLSLIGVICFATGERMPLATYFFALVILLIFYKEKRLIFFSSIIFSIFVIFIVVNTHKFYNDYNVISSTENHQGLVIEKTYKCENNKECTKIVNLQPRFFEILKNFNTSAYGEIYSLAYKMFRANPFTGIGISNYETACLNIPEFNIEMVNYNCASHPHNIYVQWLSEGGLITLTIFILYVSVLFRQIILSNSLNSYKYISLVSLIIIFWPIMSTGSLIKNWNGVFCFYIIAICLILSQSKIKNVPK